LRESLEDPKRLLNEKKFLKPDFFPLYLKRATELARHEPHRALEYLEPAPEFGARLADTHPRENGADFLILGHSHLGNAYQRLNRRPQAQEQFDLASVYRDRASPIALAKHLRYYAVLCIYQRRPEAFELLNEAMAIFKRGSLVHRHEFGECLVCRGIAYDEFNQPEKTLGDFTAALNHLSLQENATSYYCAIHNLGVYALRHGTDDDVREAVANLRMARGILAGVNRHKYAKICMRWVFGLFAFRLGEDGDAQTKFLDVAKAFQRMKLPFELACVRLDLCRLYLRQGKLDKVRDLVKETAQSFRKLGDDEKVTAAYALWREAFSRKVSDQHLVETRERFFERKEVRAA
jgi:tetratricopeptide (TPR) repeat protein